MTSSATNTFSFRNRLITIKYDWSYDTIHQSLNISSVSRVTFQRDYKRKRNRLTLMLQNNFTFSESGMIDISFYFSRKNFHAFKSEFFFIFLFIFFLSGKLTYHGSFVHFFYIKINADGIHVMPRLLFWLNWIFFGLSLGKKRFLMFNSCFWLMTEQTSDYKNDRNVVVLINIIPSLWKFI